MPPISHFYFLVAAIVYGGVDTSVPPAGPAPAGGNLPEEPGKAPSLPKPPLYTTRGRGAVPLATATAPGRS